MDNCQYHKNQFGAGQSRKRRASPVYLPNSKKIKYCPRVEEESDLNGTHIILTSDVSKEASPEILPSRCLMMELAKNAKRMKNSKVQFGLMVQFTKDDGELKSWNLSNKAMSLSSSFFNDGIQQLNEKLENYTQLSSNWRVQMIQELSMVITKTSNIINVSGSSYIPTPEGLKQTQSVVNVQNEDNLCFIYSILAVIHYDDITAHRCRGSMYNEYMQELKFKQKWMPMRLYKIRQFEQMNPGYSINVFKYNEDPLELRMMSDEYDDNDNIYKNPYVDIIYRSKSVGREIFLLLLENGNNHHYISVTNLDRLLNFRVDGHQRIQSHWCKICLHGFRKVKTYEKHIGLCIKNVDPTTLFDMPENKYIRFQDWSKTMKQKFVIYADFESILPSDKKYYQRHEPIAAGCCLVEEGVIVEYQQFLGATCVFEFLKWLENITENVIYPWFEKNSKKLMIPLTSNQLGNFYKAKECYLCKQFKEKLVRDHCHFTGNYLGAACQKCNLSRKVRPSISFVFHNLRGYDMHHILKYAISKFTTWSLSCIPQSMEKFISLIVHLKKKMTIRFIDSYMFLLCSLEKLSSNMKTLPLTSTVFDMSLVSKKRSFSV